MSQPPPALPKSLAANPCLGQWLALTAGGEVRVSPGKVEIGQGILTALATIAAEALGVAPARIRMVPPTTAASPDEGVTSGSQSIQDSGKALRHAGREVRALLIAEAARRMGADPAACVVEDGLVRGPGNAHVSYWDMADAVSLDRAATPGISLAATSGETSADLPRLDIPDKVFARPRFIQDLRLPDLRHGRVIRPARPGARLEHVPAPQSFTGAGLIALVRDGDFLGVVAESEAAAETAAGFFRARAVWSGGFDLPDEADMVSWLKSQPTETVEIDRRDGAPGAPVHSTCAQTFFRPFIAHASIAPSCALAQWSGAGAQARVTVWSHSQSIFMLRTDIAKTVRLDPAQICVEHREGAGCYGHNAADDVALDAVLLARACPGAPVRVQWTREDELARAPLGSAIAVDIAVDLDAEGQIRAWRQDVWSNGHSLRPGRAAEPTLLAASELNEGFARPISVNMPQSSGGGADRNSIPLYDLPARCILSHRVLTMPLRTSALRSLGAFANVLAIEQMMDELAKARGEDPVAFRLRHLSDARGRAVIEAAVRRAGGDVPPGQQASDEAVGRGIGFARYKNTGAYCAVVADVACAEDVRVTRLVIAVDVGEVVSHDGVVNQIEGGALQATSWTVKEAVRFDRESVLSGSWGTYPILRFSEVPAVEVEIIDRPDLPALGAGEAAHGPTAAAIANAVFNAIGVRVRHLPITRDAIISAME